jgi:hypothetical protein
MRSGTSGHVANDCSVSRYGGGVGPSDPVKAIDEVIGDGGFDEIIISTLPEGASRWLRMDVPNRVKRKFKSPVTTVTAKK